MAKPMTQFTCTACGATHKKWAGRCDACGEWNSIVEESPLSTGPGAKALGGKKGKGMALTDLATEERPPERDGSGIAEFDRVLGVEQGGVGLDQHATDAHGGSRIQVALLVADHP